MINFLQNLIAYLSAQVDAEGNHIIPPEVLPTDIDREKTYIGNLPEAPANVVMFKQYDGDVPPLTDKLYIIRRIQVLVRNTSQSTAIAQIMRLWKFLVSLEEPIVDINDSDWCIFDVTKAPVELNKDSNGNHIWSLSFPITTKI